MNNGKAKVKTCDGAHVTVELLNGNAVKTAFVEFQGLVTSATTLRAESYTDFGEKFGKSVQSADIFTCTPVKHLSGKVDCPYCLCVNQIVYSNFSRHPTSKQGMIYFMMAFLFSLLSTRFHRSVADMGTYNELCKLSTMDYANIFS